MTNEKVTAVPIEDEKVKEWVEHMYSIGEDELRMIKPYNQVLRKRYMEIHDDIQNFQTREDDVFICTAPKSGTRWMQEVMWCLRNDCDFEKANKVPLDFRTPYIDAKAVAPDGTFTENLVEKISKMEGPRSIKTHLSYDMLPKSLREDQIGKIVSVIRNPRDICASFCHHFKLTDKYTGGVELLADVYMRDVGLFYGPHFTNVLSYWSRREQDNILIVSYEEMKKDLASVIRKIADFLGKEITDEDVAKIVDFTNIENMKKNPMSNLEERINMIKRSQNNTEEKGTFINKGKTGGWKTAFTQETIQRFEEWEKKHLEGTGLSFIYEL
uniref:Sulfotransferase domain-containing protein n=1 Tax=Clytia hemisphaerica TaxID=252671 RepID=A0A7M5V297_9CNID